MVGTHNGRLWKVRCFPASPKRTSESNQVVRRASEAYKASRRGWFKFHAPVDLTALKCTQLIDVRIGLRLSMCRSVTGERVDQAAECSWSCGHRAANTRSLAALFKTGCRRSRPGGIARSNCRPDRGSSISAPRFQVLPAQDPRARPCFADHYGQCRYPRSAR